MLRRNEARAATGVPAAYLLLGAFLCCYHFMYYDVLISALPVFLLYTDPWRYLRRFQFRVGPWVINRMIPTLTVILIVMPNLLYQILQVDAFNVPADTVCIVLIWLWCGWLWLKGPEEPTASIPTTWMTAPAISQINAPKFIQRRTDVIRTHERLAD
jgi:hypothetical protein